MSTKRPESPLHGLILIDKPAGWTSHDVVAKARRITGQRRIGHTGTLDPMATGLLVLCLGQATRLVEYLTGHDKRYTGEIVLGRTTTTDDAEGETIEERPVPAVTAVELREMERRFTGPLFQLPPAFSAIKVAGKRAYAVARAGETPRLEPRPVAVHTLSLSAVSPGHLAIELHCGPGTYVRSLARDIGAALGCGGHLGSLRRHTAGPFRVEAATTLEGLEAAAERGAFEELLVPSDEGMRDHEAAILAADGCRRFAHGLMHRSAFRTEAPAEAVRIYATSGEFLGVGSVSSLGEIRPVKVLNLPN
ncbi:MAG: tRNA pseudouridine(55) synthase TruB [Dehalococcoidia bacterium]|nr:tRNA pseudouridine(55) synthase TruB [Dehalococcoidia bacterium]